MSAAPHPVIKPPFSAQANASYEGASAGRPGNMRGMTRRVRSIDSAGASTWGAAVR